MSRKDEIRYEEAYVEWVHQTLKAMIERAKAASSTAGDVGTYRAMMRQSKSQIERLRRAEGEVLFGRLDMESDDTYYIGKEPIWDDSGDNAVVDWRSPLGECFYQATKSQPGGIGRRRTIALKKKQVTGISDELLSAGFVPPVPQLDVPEPPPLETESPVVEPEVIDLRAPQSERAELPSPPLEPVESERAPETKWGLGASPAESDSTDVLEASSDAVGADYADHADVVDQVETDHSAPEQGFTVDNDFDLRAGDILLAELERERSGAMAEIVATIQADQDRLIRADPLEPLIIQGGPGTGKTVVALHRAAWVLYQQRQGNFEQSVLVVGPNRRFLNYIRQVLPSLGEMTAAQATIDDLALSQLPASEAARTSARRTDEPAATRLKGDVRMSEVVARAVWFHVAPRAIEVGFGRFNLRLSLEQVQVLIERSWFAKLSYNEARNAFKDQVIDALAVLYAERAGAGATTGDEHAQLAQRVRRMFADGTDSEPVFPRISPRAVIRRLMTDAAFRNAVADDVNDDERAILGMHDAEGSRYLWSSSDMPLIDEAAFVINGAPARFSHTIVDEAQDLSPMQWRVIRRRTAGRSATIAGDLAQATAAWAPTSWSDVAKWAKFGDDVVVSELNLGYRVPLPIMEYAGRLLPHAAPSVKLPHSFRTGMEPVAHLAARNSLIQSVIGIADEWRLKSGTVAIVCPPDLERRLTKAVADLPQSDGIDVVADIGAKGLEFDRIIVVEPQLIARDGINGLRRLYICLTRATQELAIVHTEPLPVELGLPQDEQHRSEDLRRRMLAREERLKGSTGTKLWRGQVAEQYPQAYRRWAVEEEALLRAEVASGLSTEAIAEAHQRRPGGIKARMKRLGLGDSDSSSAATLYEALRLVLLEYNDRRIAASELADQANERDL